MAKVKKFAFNCRGFEIVAAADGLLIPGTRAAGTLKASTIPPMDLNDCAGTYTMKASSAGSVLFKGPVRVLWGDHDKEPDPFLCFRCDDTEAVVGALKVHNGEDVLLEFRLDG
ncbi:hypothetical protein [Dongia sedimenti]|uniref:Uncharacterized protein n=1 Tax=Dongia sedimenti TaxID=3064282 RepID=A0ABU0YTJ8_9PROT|nr:hypothetical protein [Rhodospirillaceae bacterium R-7]